MEKKFRVEKSGAVMLQEDGLFKSVGRATYGKDLQDREKVLFSIGDKQYSIFLNTPVKQQELNEFREWKKSNLGK